jgi:hypothetical protein
VLGVFGVDGGVCALGSPWCCSVLAWCCVTESETCGVVVSFSSVGASRWEGGVSGGEEGLRAVRAAAVDGFVVVSWAGLASVGGRLVVDGVGGGWRAVWLASGLDGVRCGWRAVWVASGLGGERLGSPGVAGSQDTGALEGSIFLRLFGCCTLGRFVCRVFIWVWVSSCFKAVW